MHQHPFHHHQLTLPHFLSASEDNREDKEDKVEDTEDNREDKEDSREDTKDNQQYNNIIIYITFNK